VRLCLGQMHRAKGYTPGPKEIKSFCGLATSAGLPVEADRRRLATDAGKHFLTCKNTHQRPFEAFFGKFYANLRAKMVNYKVPLALRKAKYKVHVSKNRNLRSEHSRATSNHLSEHLAG